MYTYMNNVHIILLTYNFDLLACAIHDNKFPYITIKDGSKLIINEHIILYIPANCVNSG